MKRLFLLVVILLFLNGLASASMVQTGFDQTGGVKKLTYTCTFNSGGGAWTSATTRRINGYILRVATNPGTPAPKADYDIVINLDGVDVMDGDLADRATATDESTDYKPYPVSGELTVVASGNDVDLAVFELIIYYVDTE